MIISPFNTECRTWTYLGHQLHKGFGLPQLGQRDYLTMHWALGWVLDLRLVRCLRHWRGLDYKIGTDVPAMGVSRHRL